MGHYGNPPRIVRHGSIEIDRKKYQSMFVDRDKLEMRFLSDRGKSIVLKFDSIGELGAACAQHEISKLKNHEKVYLDGSYGRTHF